MLWWQRSIISIIGIHGCSPYEGFICFVCWCCSACECGCYFCGLIFIFVAVVGGSLFMYSMLLPLDFGICTKQFWSNINDSIVIGHCLIMTECNKNSYAQQKADNIFLLDAFTYTILTNSICMRSRNGRGIQKNISKEPDLSGLITIAFDAWKTPLITSFIAYTHYSHQGRFRWKASELISSILLSQQTIHNARWANLEPMEQPKSEVNVWSVWVCARRILKTVFFEWRNISSLYKIYSKWLY